MASLNPFETKRKKAPQGTSSQVCEVQVAEEAELTPNSLSSQPTEIIDVDLCA
jgi:hypothetical protein